MPPIEVLYGGQTFKISDSHANREELVKLVADSLSPKPRMVTLTTAGTGVAHLVIGPGIAFAVTIPAGEPEE